MAKDSRKVLGEEAIRSEEATTLETLIRRRARGLIDAIVAEELEAALGAAESARVGPVRQGYRHGTRERTLTTSLGPTTFAMPRARVRTAEGATAEWRSELVRSRAAIFRLTVGSRWVRRVHARRNLLRDRLYD